MVKGCCEDGSVAASFPLEESHVLSCALPALLSRGGDIHAALEELGGSCDVWTHTIVGGAQLDVRVPADGITNEELRRSYEQEQNPSHELVKRQSTDSFFSSYQSTATIKSKLASWAETYPQLAKYTPSVGKTIQAFPAATKRPSGGTAVNTLVNGFRLRLSCTLPTSFSACTPVKVHTVAAAGIKTTVLAPKAGAAGLTSVAYGIQIDVLGSALGTGTSTSHMLVPLLPRPTKVTWNRAFSEPETKALSNYILSVSNRYAMIDFHMNLWSIDPLQLGWTDTLSQNEKILKTLSDGMKSAISSQSETSYTSEIGAALYPAAGCTDDWSTAKGKMIAYTIERSTSSFVLATAQIIPTGEENMKYFFSFLRANPNIPANPVPFVLKLRASYSFFFGGMLEEADFCQTLEMATLLFVGETIFLTYRSSYVPVRNCVDGNLVERFMGLTAPGRRAVAEELDRTPMDLSKRVEDARDRPAFWWNLWVIFMSLSVIL
ncbi:hypothetical protein BJ742DRAFT_775658 [Cladochytrium replicatum]|nr:hypothetical protein BJ742DRAFT_775658 [Cladochytrium replicatum]